VEHKRETPLLRLTYLEECLCLRRVYAKCEMRNPTGTHKDRVADGLVRAAIEDGRSGITVGSCGNLGVALARAGHLRGLSCTVFVPRTYRQTRPREMRDLGAEVMVTGDSYEAAVEASREFAHERQLFDANPVGRGGEIAISEYGQIVDELMAQCPAPLGSIWLPVGNGTCVAGLFARLQHRELAVSIGVVGSAGNTALTASLTAGRLVELDAAGLRETEVNEPLVNWRSLHAREAMEAVSLSGGHFCDATDEDLVVASQTLWRGAGIRASAAGAAGLVGLRLFSKHLAPDAAHLVILTA
jgi:threonine synthase